MPPRGKAADLERWLAQHHPSLIGEAEFARLRESLAPVSESYLRKLVRDSAVALHPLVEGVRQSTLDELEATLLRLLVEYEPGDAARRMKVRRLVITAKEHARLASRNPQHRVQKQEMILWMTTWLDNPPLFRDWIAIRRTLHSIS